MCKLCSINGGKEEAYNIFVGKPKGKGPVGRPKKKWDNNSKISDWIDLA
jgi:hypothetical protein